MAKLNKGLGMGLEALLKMNVQEDEPDNKTVVSSEDKVLAGFVELPLDKVIVNPEQPRKTFNEEALEELAQSIKNFGLIQPITVIKKENLYEIITGERRYRAAKIAGLEKIPVIIKDITQKEKLEISLVENIQRENLNSIEEALAYSSLIESYNVTQEELAQRLGKSRTTITNSIRLLNLDVQVRKWVMDGKLTPGHARAVLSIEDAKEHVRFAAFIMENEFSVREAEVLAKNWPPVQNKKSTVPAIEKPFEIQNAEKLLEEKLHTKVAINGSSDKGKIQIDYFSQEELERLLDVLGVNL